ncbi:MAG TPA: hypothetical protein IAB65_02165 [Candidatus Onthocola stercorigallinarum]|nr:hypothetical protein [Candidatus Onthocola stercorigallinarum]
MKNKKIIFGVSIMCVIVISITLILITNKSSSKILDSNLENTTDNLDNKAPGMFAIMLETQAGSGKYEQSTSGLWPGSGYMFNETLSTCENGGILTWNEENRTVNLKSNLSDKCYLYFDIVPPDVTLATTNTGYGATPATLSCSNATATYNQKYSRVQISQVNRPNRQTGGNCTLTYQTPSSINYLNNYIIGLAGTTQGTGQVVNENGYRYEGKDPNNYVWFNNELWRIIGVFDSASHGVSGQNLVKIIRNDSIGGLAWDKNSTNDWPTASLMNLLNGAYLNSENGTGGEYCYGYSTSVPANCDYTESGINDTYRSMIENVTWYLGGYSSTSATAESFYGYERGTTVYSGRPTSTTGYIGLMYPSDYGYSVLSSSCARTKNLGSYSNSTCAGQSWMYGQGYEWTITPTSSNSSDVFRVDGNGYLYSLSALNGNSARPVLYLDSSVYVIDGNGSQSDPYIIGMG